MKIEEAFNRVRGHVSASVFLLAVVDRLMRLELVADVFLDAGRVRVQACVLGNVLAHDHGDRGRRHERPPVPLRRHHTGAACWRADSTAAALGGGLARAGVRFVLLG